MTKNKTFPQVAQLKIKERKQKSERIITLIIDKDRYQYLLENAEEAKKVIDSQFLKYPLLFPPHMQEGYILNITTCLSIKTGLRKRLLLIGGTYYQLYPSW